MSLLKTMNINLWHLSCYFCGSSEINSFSWLIRFIVILVIVLWHLDKYYNKLLTHEFIYCQKKKILPPIWKRFFCWFAKTRIFMLFSHRKVARPKVKIFYYWKAANFSSPFSSNIWLHKCASWTPFWKESYGPFFCFLKAVYFM